MVKQSNFNIVGIGELVWDIYPKNRYIGGSAANFAIHSNRLGNNGIIVSRVGNDNAGSEIIKALQQRNINVDFVQIDPQIKTGIVQLSVDNYGIPHYKCSTEAAFDYIQDKENINEIPNMADAIYFDLIAQRNSITRTTIHSILNRANNALKIFDINIRSWTKEINVIIQKSLKIADAIKANLDEIETLQQEWQHPEQDILDFVKFLLRNYSIKIAAITLGESGCYLINEKQIFKQEIAKNGNVIDTNGAGDAFTAAFVHKYLRGAPLPEIANFSTEIAALVVKANGATPVI